MELGALICTASKPRCNACPIASTCAWRLAGSPTDGRPPRRAQTWVGTDRQARGRLLAILRAATEPVPQHTLDTAWPADPVQRARALDGLVTDGLVEVVDGPRYRLPTA